MRQRFRGLDRLHPLRLGGAPLGFAVARQVGFRLFSRLALGSDQVVDRRLAVTDLGDNGCRLQLHHSLPAAPAAVVPDADLPLYQPLAI